jgi:hypothetical protein
MGYELELAPRAEFADHGWVDRRLALRWQHAEQRLFAALSAYAAVRRTSAPGEPAWIEAQLRLAEARLRWRECAEEAERLAELADGPGLFR